MIMIVCLANHGHNVDDDESDHHDDDDGDLVPLRIDHRLTLPV